MTKLAEELRECDDDELDTRLENARRELFNLRFQVATGRLDNVSRIGQVRRQVARILTVVRDREIAEAEGRSPAHEAESVLEHRAAAAAAAPAAEGASGARRTGAADEASAPSADETASGSDASSTAAAPGRARRLGRRRSATPLEEAWEEAGADEGDDTEDAASLLDEQLEESELEYDLAEDEDEAEDETAPGALDVDDATAGGEPEAVSKNPASGTPPAVATDSGETGPADAEEEDE